MTLQRNPDDSTAKSPWLYSEITMTLQWISPEGNHCSQLGLLDMFWTTFGYLILEQSIHTLLPAKRSSAVQRRPSVFIWCIRDGLMFQQQHRAIGVSVENAPHQRSPAGQKPERYTPNTLSHLREKQVDVVRLGVRDLQGLIHHSSS